MPDDLKRGVEQLSDYSLDDVRVHYNSDKPAQLDALAYTQGTEIHVAPGQQRHLPHEAWHVVQQKQGRVKPTLQMKGGVGVNDESALEREADVMGAKASRMTRDAYAEALSTPRKSTSRLQGRGAAFSAPVQRYATKSTGLSVAGELHKKSPEREALDKEFAHSVKGVDMSTLCLWQEPYMPGTGSLAVTPDLSESADHYVAWDIDRIEHHYSILHSEIRGLLAGPRPASGKYDLKPPTAAKILVSAGHIMDVFEFIEEDLGSPRLKATDSSALQTDVAALKSRLEALVTDLRDAAKTGEISRTNCESFNAEHSRVSGWISVIQATVETQQPGITASRKVSYDFTRTVAMHDLANSKKDVPGIWVIGQYHVQEIKENLLGTVSYDLVPMPIFDKDVRDFVAKDYHGTVDPAKFGNRFGEILTCSRLLKSSLEYFRDRRDETDESRVVEFHVDRFTYAAGVLEEIDNTVLKGMTISAAVKPPGFDVNDISSLIQAIDTGKGRFEKASAAKGPDVGSGSAADASAPDPYSELREDGLYKAVCDLHALTGLAEFHES